MPRKIILIRHAESYKNLNHIHGGKGEELTLTGISQSKAVARMLKDNLSVDSLKIFAPTSAHARETAKIIADELNLSVERPLHLRPLDFGVADGLTEDELAAKYPTIDALFKQWRRREIDIKQLTITGMESPLSFWNRGVEFLNTLSGDFDNVLICTNSLMILFANIMLGNHPVETNNYKHISIDNCGVIAFEQTSDGGFKLCKALTDVNINR